MNSDKKKRLIIPVATLIVAIVMMAGVGYAAISSTFTVDGNTTAGGELEVSVGIDGTTNKILNDAKIPFGVKTTNVTDKKYTIADGTYVLAKNMAVTITDNTEQNYDKYKITTSIESTKLDAISGITLGCVVTNGTYTEGATSLLEIAKESTTNLKLTVTLTAASVADFTDINYFKADDVIISITIEGAYSTASA